MRVGMGLNQESDARLAGKLSAQLAVQQSGEPEVTFLFCTDGYDPGEVLKGVREITGSSKLAGACVPGIIAGDRVYKNGVGICTIAGTGIEAVTWLQEKISDSPYHSGEEAGQRLRESGLDGGTVFIFPDGLSANISELLRGFYNALGPGFNYVGGGAGDNLKFYKTYQFTERGFSSNAVAAALISGVDFKIATGHGWQPAGELMMVTRASGKKILELDGVPAFRRYSQCLGGIDRDRFSYYGMKHPLGIPSSGENFIIRDPLNVEDDGSIVLVTEVPQNTIATIMMGEIEELVDAAAKVARSAAGYVSRPEVALVFDCVSRYLLMEAEFQQEIKAVVDNIGPDVPLLGMLSFGEVSSVTGIPLFYNKTLAVAVG